MKKFKDKFTIIILFFFIFEIITNSSLIMNTIGFSIDIWKNNIFPSLFPFFVLSDLLINYGFIETTSKLFKPLMKLFKIKSECAFIFVLSIFSGFPSNSKYTKELYDKGIINNYEATKILMCTHFSNPIFILGTITVFLNKKLAIIILISHYIGNLLIGIIFRNYHPSNYKNINNEITKKETKNFIEVLTNSLIKTIDTLLLLLGIITTFLIITTVLDKNLNIPDIYQYILNGIIEMTQGLKYVSDLNIDINIKAIIFTFFLSFGGICIHTQVKSILKGTDIKYLPYLLARITHGIISSLITTLIICLY
ncbi:MAG: hypothetical protein NC181_01360 [Clostridium sp.]|nr:hypothetical protein [Clostridium sp.]MCM1443974.1 hypothetical protein [Candidatus Amulumruptor caecigallinarius]